MHVPAPHKLLIHIRVGVLRNAAPALRKYLIYHCNGCVCVTPPYPHMRCL